MEDGAKNTIFNLNLSPIITSLFLSDFEKFKHQTCSEFHKEHDGIH